MDSTWQSEWNGRIKEFFDKRALEWAHKDCPPEPLVREILRLARIKPGDHVLDVACGYGVLFPFYLRLGVSSITGVDLSDMMIALAKQKFSSCPNVYLIRGDIQTICLNQLYEQCMIYNAFPHFPDPDRLIARLYTCLKPGGRLTVAHSMGRDKLNSLHHKRAQDVSVELITASELAIKMEPWFYIDNVVSTDQMYLVSGEKKISVPCCTF